MAKLHLCLICGRDNRYDYVRHTVRQSLPVFDAIHIMDTGSTDRTRDLKARSPKINYFHWNRWELGWGDAYDCVRRDVPQGDWFLYLDSDELPSQYMLDHIHDAVVRIEKEGYGQAQIPNVLHMDGKRVGHPAEKLPRTPEEFANNKCWTKSIICCNGPWLEVRNYGMHAGYCNTEYPLAYLPLYYCHHKHKAQVDASMSICSFLMPESYDIPRDSEENGSLRHLAARFSIDSPNQLVDLLQRDPPDAFVKLVASWENHPLRTCRHWHAWYRAGFAVGNYPLSLCEEPCCRYRETTDSETEVDAGSIPRLVDGWALKDDGVIRLVGPEERIGMECNAAAVAVVSRMDGRQTIADIVYELAEAFPEAAADVRDDTLELMEKLSEGMVVSLRTTDTPVSPATSRRISDAVECELAYWRQRGGWDATQLRGVAESRRWIHVSFHDGTVRFRWPGNGGGRCRVLGPYLQRIAMDSPDIVGEFVINTHDAVTGDAEFPVLGFSKREREEAAVLIPDVYFVNGYAPLHERILETASRVRWNDKLPRAVWRGSATGQVNTESNWRDNLRVRLCLLSRARPQSVDARLVSLSQSDETTKQLMKEAMIDGDYMPEQTQMLYKYIINVDGNSSSWSGMYWKLLANSLMIQLEPEHVQAEDPARASRSRPFLQWYHHWLQRDRHYLSCRLDDLENVIRWAGEHDDRCREIADNATAFVKEYLSEDAGRLYTSELLRAMSRLAKPNRPLG